MAQSELSNPLLTEIQYIKRVGPRRARAFGELGIHTVYDLLTMYPRKYLDRRSIVTIADLWKYAGTNTEVTVVAIVRGKDIIKGYKKRDRFVLVVGDEHSFLDCIWFQRPQIMDRIFRRGDRIALSGPVTDYQGTLQMVHPAFDRLTSRKDEEEGGPDWNDFFNTGRILPIYTVTGGMKETGLEGGVLRSVMLHAVESFGNHLEEHLPDEIVRSRKLMSYPDAMRSVHFPETSEAAQHARERIKFDELFYLQMLLAYRRRVSQHSPGIPFNVKSRLARRLVEALPFPLTDAQKRVIREIADDMQKPHPMHRLLQGDVGSGKTIVSLTAMLVAVENGYQAVLMVPTEILAVQHYATIRQLLQSLDIHSYLLIGSQKKSEREESEKAIADGSAQVIIGTHALFQENINFKKLGLLVIDEQHRFGVMQRLRLYSKGATPESDHAQPDLLILTATPIPRTLSLTLYGDLETSVLDEKPPGRRSVKTAVRHKSERQKVYSFALDEVKRGRQVYVVYPLIEESEKLDLKAATQGFEELNEGIFKDYSVALIHGRLSREENEDIMVRFRDGRIDVLVATTVIEVGVDVPNATVMIIEHAERFGLSQLHQLRGRVGRGSDQSYCILIHYLNPIIKGRNTFPTDRSAKNEEEKHKGRVRLETIAGTDDGFRIAEVDLELRGPGEFFGTRQSGFPELKLASLLYDKDVLFRAREDAFSLVGRDPQLRDPAHDRTRRYFEIYMKPLLDFVKAG
jgi:ATP-dependent DNA helicase RecG